MRQRDRGVPARGAGREAGGGSFDSATSVIPTLDGNALSKPFAATDAAGVTTGSFADGDFNRVPVIEGSNHDEYRLFTASADRHPPQPGVYSERSRPRCG